MKCDGFVLIELLFDHNFVMLMCDKQHSMSIFQTLCDAEDYRTSPSTNGILLDWPYFRIPACVLFGKFLVDFL